MPAKTNRTSKANAADESEPVVLLDLGPPDVQVNDVNATATGTEGSLSSPAMEAASASVPQAPEPGAPATKPLNTANFVDPKWRGKKYITPEVFRRRVYAYFGRRPSLSTIHRWLHEGRIYAVRINTRWLIPEGTWEEFLKGCQMGDRF